jgi:hypothetical protein
MSHEPTSPSTVNVNWMQQGRSASSAIWSLTSSSRGPRRSHNKRKNRGSHTGYPCRQSHPPLLLICSEWSLIGALPPRTARVVIDGRCGHLPGYDGGMSLAHFVLRYLPPAPARVLEIGSADPSGI